MSARKVVTYEVSHDSDTTSGTRTITGMTRYAALRHARNCEDMACNDVEVYRVVTTTTRLKRKTWRSK